MKQNQFIIKFNELTLKGKNKIQFERTLIRNIKDCLKKNKVEYKSIRKTYNRLIIESSDCSCLKDVFGIAYICKAVKTPLTIEDIEKHALSFVKNLGIEQTFKVNATRANKNFVHNSMDVNRIIGSAISKKTHARANLASPDIEVFIEILDEAYVYTTKIRGFGGLPIGTEGRVLALLQDNASILAAILAMRRGCSLIPVYLKKKDTGLLERYAYGFEINPIKIKSIEDIDPIAKQKHAKALIIGQTLEDLAPLPVKTPILRPLIAFDSGEIEHLLSSF